MPQESPAPARQTQFRRRIPLELTAEQLALLEREEKRFGTKRATLVAGLEALARLLGLEQELEAATQARDEALARADALAGQAKKTEGVLAKQKGEAGAAKRERQAAARRQQKTTEEAQAEIDRLARALDEEQDVRLGLEHELGALERELLDGAYCPRCSKWVQPEQWAVKEEGEYELLYHGRCGFHPDDGLTTARSVFGFRKRS